MGTQLKVSEENGYAYTPYAGVVYPPFMVPQKIDQLRESFHVEADDVVIATFPKAGTTWMQQIVLLIFNGGDVSQISNPMRMSPWLEGAVSNKVNGLPGGLDIDELRARPKPRAWKTHAPAHLVPWAHCAGKTIVVARNPYDTAVSMFHHSLDIPDFAFAASWAVFAAFFLEGNVESGSFWDWYGGWWALHQQSQAAGAAGPVLWVTYEQLQENLGAQVARIAAFVGVDAAPDLVAKVVAGSTFDHMKVQFADHDAKLLASGGSPKKNHIRQGKVGGWKSYFTEEQKAAFDAKTAALSQLHSDLVFTM